MRFDVDERALVEFGMEVGSSQRQSHNQPTWKHPFFSLSFHF